MILGPGGFSEYVLYRKKWEAKGFGFTLKGENDFKLHDFFAGPSETFSPFYGINDDGNIYDPENIRSLDELVKNATESGVSFGGKSKNVIFHLSVSDFSVTS